MREIGNWTCDEVQQQFVMLRCRSNLLSLCVRPSVRLSVYRRQEKLTTIGCAPLMSHIFSPWPLLLACIPQVLGILLCSIFISEIVRYVNDVRASTVRVHLPFAFFIVCVYLFVRFTFPHFHFSLLSVHLLILLKCLLLFFVFILPYSNYFS